MCSQNLNEYWRVEDTMKSTINPFVLKLFTKIFIFILLVVGLSIPSSALAISANSFDQYATGDIQFCPSGKPYGDADCSDPRTMLSDAIQDAKDAAANGVSGTIYMEDGTYSNTTYNISGSLISITGFDYGTSLTIQGGVNGGTTTLVRRLAVNNNAGLDFSLQDITLSPSDSSLSEYGFWASTNNGDLQFSNVQILDSNYSGVYIYAQTGDVSFQDVTANANSQENIALSDISGNVNFTNVQASGSTGGAGITMNTVAGKKGITLTNVTAQNNYSDNLNLQTVTGNVNISDSTISDSVNGLGVYMLAIHGKKGVVIENTSSSSNNGSNFTITNIDGAVTLTEVSANSSTTGLGIDLSAISGSKGTTLTAITANGNTDSNIALTNSEAGATLTDIESKSSGSYGIRIHNFQGKKGVSLKDIVTQDNNAYNIYLTSIPSKISILNATANTSPAGEGIYINNSGSVTLTDVTASGNSTYNINLTWLSGDVTLKSVICENAVNEYGIYMYNIQGKKGVTLSGVNANNNEDTNIAIGTVNGNITLSNVYASNSNTYRGIDIGTINGSKGVTLKDVFANSNKDGNIFIANIAGNASFSNIEAKSSVNSNGLTLNTISGSKGVSISTADTTENKVKGMFINNITGGVKLSDVISINNAGGEGIELTTIDGSAGVSLDNCNASDNKSDNIRINGVVGGASFSDSYANGSKTGYGLYLYNVQGSKGISFKSFNAQNNNLTNVYINTVAGGVSVKGMAATNSATTDGLYLTDVMGSKGVKISGLTASSNNATNISISNITGDLSLAYVYADDSSIDQGLYINTVQGKKGVTLKSSAFTGNYSSNLYVENVSPGNVVVSGVTADSSDIQHGASFYNIDGTLMVISSTFNGNAQTGIYVTMQNGLILLKSVEGSNNVGGNGAYLISNNNQLVCSSTFNNNNSYGIENDPNTFSLTTSQVTTDGNGLGSINYTGAYADNTKCAVIPAPTP
jgi:hypothetical protein